MTIAFVYPGQGSQVVGMAKDLYDNFSVAKDVLDRVCATLKQDLKTLMFDGPTDELTLTENTQPALLAGPASSARGCRATRPRRRCPSRRRTQVATTWVRGGRDDRRTKSPSAAPPRHAASEPRSTRVTTFSGTCRARSRSASCRPHP
ncbi:MAG: ACP S-malonyltransferase [Actinobacteria bacterium]|nr:ACP S-malonyltransferase [Actinomycetota bacterium]